MVNVLGKEDRFIQMEKCNFFFYEKNNRYDGEWENDKRHG
jgi:hypothetical protein